MKNSWKVLRTAALAAAVLCFVVASGPVQAQVNPGGTEISWTVKLENEGTVLTVAEPEGTVGSRDFKAGETPAYSVFDENGKRRPDGSYAWELRVLPVVSPEVRAQLAAARETEDDKIMAALLAELRRTGQLPEESALVQAGSFLIQGGAIVADGRAEAKSAVKPQVRAEAEAEPGVTITTAADEVVDDDLIVQGSVCVGFDCVNNESFGFDTIRLKENNLRIKFQDTSVGTFPSADWQLTANESFSGGAGMFSIESIENLGVGATASRAPFKVMAGAPTHSMLVDPSGRIGLRTFTPVLDLHVHTSNTPSLRLEQNSSGGFTRQTWDVGGNEVNFFVRDVTGGSRMPFRIRPGAPTSSLDINGSGNVGIGTSQPREKLEVVGGNILVTGGTFIADGTELNVPDYVFEPGYELMPIAELKAFVEREKHLPNVPNRGEVRAEGLDLSQFQMRLLEKVEELALYTVQQHDEIQTLRDQNAALQDRLKALEESLAAAFR